MVSAMSSAFPGSECAGRVVDGRFSLLRWLGGTAHSSIFLTEIDGDPPQQATIKFVPADDARSAQWAAAQALSHPNLVPLIHFGRCEMDGHKLAYAVTEYADEVLAEILAQRPLSPAETAEMVPAVVDALEYFHAQGLVHGGLTPANILAAGDHLKLSVDGIEAAGEPASDFHPPSDYDAPELPTRNMAPAMDVWSLGAVLVKALTQQMPAWDRAGGGEPVVPSSIPEPYASIARDCLRVDPARRCTLADIRARLEPAPDAASEPEPVPVPAPLPAAPPVSVPAGQIAGKSRSRFPLTIAVLAVLIAVVLIAAVEMRSHRTQAPPDAETQSSSPPSAGQQPSAEAPARAGSAANGAVVHKVLPEAPQTAMDTIHGHFMVAIRVDVDPEGNVSNATIDAQGPSRYFAGFALNAARGWKFRPAEKDGRAVASTWVLHFVFGRDGVEATPVETRP